MIVKYNHNKNIERYFHPYCVFLNKIQKTSFIFCKNIQLFSLYLLMIQNTNTINENIRTRIIHGSNTPLNIRCSGSGNCGFSVISLISGIVLIAAPVLIYYRFKVQKISP